MNEYLAYFQWKLMIIDEKGCKIMNL